MRQGGFGFARITAPDRNRGPAGSVIPAMPPMESLLILWLSRLAAAVDLVTGLLIAFAVGEATLRLARLSLAAFTSMPAGHEAVRLRLGNWLALALEFALASDLIRTAVAPSWDEIGKLAAIMALRTALNYFLEREFEQVAQLPVEPMRAAA
jgi:uncharacterized membrane protein